MRSTNIFSRCLQTLLSLDCGTGKSGSPRGLGKFRPNCLASRQTMGGQLGPHSVRDSISFRPRASLFYPPKPPMGEPNWSQQPVRLIPARSHAPRDDPRQAIHCAVEGLDAKRSAAVLVSSPAAAQRCTEGAGLDSGTVAAAQSAMPSIAACRRTDCKQHFHWRRPIRRSSATVPNLHQLDGRDPGANLSRRW